MKKAFITGANKSIGLETARQLLQQGMYVYLGSRSMENGLTAVEQLNKDFRIPFPGHDDAEPLLCPGVAFYGKGRQAVDVGARSRPEISRVVPAPVV